MSSGRYAYFVGTYGLHFEGRGWRQHFSRKCW